MRGNPTKRRVLKKRRAREDRDQSRRFAVMGKRLEATVARLARTHEPPIRAEDWKIDRTGWGPGPWDEEPDAVEWTTKVGLFGKIVRNGMGGLCGYVAIPPEHPAHGMHYDQVDVECHGGLTYGKRCSGAICHFPEPGEPDDVWWLGFDCGHCFDLMPGLEATMRRLREKDPILLEMEKASGLPRDIYRNMIYVRDEVEELAKQLAEMA